MHCSDVQIYNTHYSILYSHIYREHISNDVFTTVFRKSLCIGMLSLLKYIVYLLHVEEDLHPHITSLMDATQGRTLEALHLGYLR